MARLQGMWWLSRRRVLTTAAAVGAIVLLACKSLLVEASKVNGAYMYSYVVATGLAELAKLVVTLGFVVAGRWGKATLRLDLTESVQYAIPAIIYLFNNNIVFIILYFVDPATFQILSNMKIITTALLFRLCILKKPLSTTKWVALLLLALGTCVTQLDELYACTRKTERDATVVALAMGVGCSLAQSLLSAAGGVFVVCRL